VFITLQGYVICDNTLFCLFFACCNWAVVWVENLIGQFTNNQQSSLTLSFRCNIFQFYMLRWAKIESVSRVSAEKFTRVIVEGRKKSFTMLFKWDFKVVTSFIAKKKTENRRDGWRRKEENHIVGWLVMGKVDKL
jgi:hypothetical protein